jgi:cholesterol transport system auxiliary component
MTRTIAILLLLTGGCSALDPSTKAPPSRYALDGVPIASQAPRAAAAPTLVVNPPHAAAGFDSQHIAYLREAHKREYFAHNEWIDTPARMLAPLIISAVEAGGAFRAVVLTPSAAAGELRLDTEILRLEHDFRTQPSRVRFTLRAYIVDSATRKVLAWQEFDETVPAQSEDPHGGVIAANRAVQAVLQQLADLCAKTAQGWTPRAAEARLK